MKAYIRSAAAVSPQNTFNNPLFLDDVVEHSGTRLNCIEPDYHSLIDPKLSRRMSRIIKMSVACAFACLQNAWVEQPQAIVTGTAYGCLEDTGNFLSSIVEQDEDPVSPVAFVQSTHNTIGAQIALLLKSHGYNNTFVNGGVSFENALLDAMMLLREGYSDILVGGMDEITDMSHAILTRTGIYRRGAVSNLQLFEPRSKGTIAGEGASFFLLNSIPSNDDLACIEAVSTFHKPVDRSEVIDQIKSFLNSQSIEMADIDLLLTGDNGDIKNDAIYDRVRAALFSGVPSARYKHLCGEYPVSSAFALWLSANMVKTNSVPPATGHDGHQDDKISKVLIYNHYQNIHHSLILVSAC
jgi:3-oxoacyl-(acyl-carrier-protein) synthase